MNKFLGGLLLMLAACSYADTNMLVFSKAQPQFVITLPSNPTTGYQWKVTSYDKTLFQLKSSRYSPSKTSLVGAGGTMSFTFMLNKGQVYPASSKMSFIYARPWDASSQTMKTIRLKFQ